MYFCRVSSIVGTEHGSLDRALSLCENHHQWSDEMTQYGLQVCEYLKQCQMNRLVNDGVGGFLCSK